VLRSTSRAGRPSISAARCSKVAPVAGSASAAAAAGTYRVRSRCIGSPLAGLPRAASTMARPQRSRRCSSSGCHGSAGAICPTCSSSGPRRSETLLSAGPPVTCARLGRDEDLGLDVTGTGAPAKWRADMLSELSWRGSAPSPTSHVMTSRWPCRTAACNALPSTEERIRSGQAVLLLASVRCTCPREAHRCWDRPVSRPRHARPSTPWRAPPSHYQH
jgi:hypothetical protein